MHMTASVEPRTEWVLCVCLWNTFFSAVQKSKTQGVTWSVRGHLVCQWLEIRLKSKFKTTRCCKNTLHSCNLRTGSKATISRAIEAPRGRDHQKGRVSRATHINTHTHTFLLSLPPRPSPPHHPPVTFSLMSGYNHCIVHRDRERKGPCLRHTLSPSLLWFTFSSPKGALERNAIWKADS